MSKLAAVLAVLGKWDNMARLRHQLRDTPAPPATADTEEVIAA